MARETAARSASPAARALTCDMDGVRAFDAGRATTFPRALQQLTRQKAKSLTPGAPADPAGPDDRAALLVLEAAIFATEAEVRWLDHCDLTLTRPNSPRGTPR